MITKYILHIGLDDYELKYDDLRNWDDILCSYKRNEFEGILRSFTSSFEFVNHARELLMSLYLRDGFAAQASIEVLTMNDCWGFDKRFECPLDFSTIQLENSVLSINSVESDLETLIKGNKSTTYEYAIGTAIEPDDTFYFDRLPMQESVLFEFTKGTSWDDRPDIIVSFHQNELPWIGSISSEIAVNGCIQWNDDQTNDPDSYMLKAIKSCRLKMTYDVTWLANRYITQRIALAVNIRRNGEYVSNNLTGGNGGYFIDMPESNVLFLGQFTSSEALPSPEEYPNSYVIIDEKVWVVVTRGAFTYWQNTDQTESEYFANNTSGEVVLNLQEGDEVVMTHTCNSFVQVQFTKTAFKFSWFGIGEPMEIDVFKPRTVAMQLLRNISAGEVNVNVAISSHDPRLADTWIISSQSIRGLADAKITSSFDDFCNWMTTVFGYVYYLEEAVANPYIGIREVEMYEYSPWQFVASKYHGDVSPENIVYIVESSRFMYWGDDGKLYISWDGDEEYSGEDGHPRTDMLFLLRELDENNYYYFESYVEGEPLMPIRYEHSIDNLHKPVQTLRFVHRSEIFRDDAPIFVFENCRDLKYSVDTNAIYASVNVGYDKKDYNSINGRDEFNFNNTYTLGCCVSDKSLSLKSKYRADCYGIEFEAQKRGKDTTDSSSDSNVFFALLKSEEGKLVADRDITIENAISDKVFNGAFSPMACIRANAGLIGLQAEDVLLTFASSEGNTSVVINGEGMSDNLQLSERFATCGILEFTTDEIDERVANGAIIEVREEDVVYRGYLKEVDVSYSREEVATYQLIVKEIEP